MKHRATDINQLYMIDGSNEATDNHETFANAKFANELVSDDGGAIIVYICHIHTFCLLPVAIRSTITLVWFSFRENKIERIHVI